MISSLVQFISFVKTKAISTIEQQKWKGHKKRDRLLVLKVLFKYQISQRVKALYIDPVFSNWVYLIKKVSILNCCRNTKNFKGIYFLL